MEREFLGKVEDNAAVRVWSEKVQQEKGDSVAKGYTSELWDFTRISVTQNNKHLFRALVQYWNPAYSCFMFGKVDLVPIVEEYTTLLRCPRPQIDKAYLKQKRVVIFALSIYGLVNFTKALGHVDEVVSDMFDRLDKEVTLSLLEGGKVSYLVFSENYSPLKELVVTPRRDDITEEKWMAILQNLQEDDIEWKAPWMVPDEILYQCGDFDWVSLLGIWGAVGYTLLLVL
ncbi:hypothetical protein Goshw_024556 [Gossypium schwendimanii]|uniref:DUF7745 domain-containing protein n=1 Tax=Gossypium schwendimanii TaxID=34291 RepID=A0A7J9L599_GOSSC|nr:hypothetical protein [Gossypium schwendimanii]